MTDISRRRVIQMAGGFALTGVAGRWLAVPEALAAAEAPATDQMNDFLAISRQLTQNESLDENLAGALLQAGKLALADFDDRLARLKSLLSEQPQLLAQPTLAFGEAHAAEETLARDMLSGWYTGVVGSGEQAVYVTYLNSLSNQVVADTLVPPSFSYGPCGSWHRAP
ncbi:sorbitol dehydrogenase family protein [Salinicola avicenniae]|uniref:sorbitol dehydrogenase family protein n=1 Tax=Salinicola avicenniae TaxID=2916836 RepID=UPI002072A745|nr:MULTISPECIES: sorbitol dehydrogenase family protein [unclassified Salinicola]